jgi:parvulin-like peptidyl-prolyl isomerase
MLLEEFLRVQAMLMEARSQGLDEDAEVQAEFERLLVRTFRSRTLTEKLDDVLVSEEEISSAYQKRVAEFTQPGTDRFAMLYLKKEPGRVTISIERLEKARAEILKQIQAGAPVNGFGALAVSCSDDQASRYRGGDVGWVRQAQDSPRLPSVVLDSARKLNPGEVTPVLESDSGHFVVMKTDTRPSRVTPFVEVRTHLHRRLLSEKKKNMEETFYTTYLKKADPKINTEGLAGLALKRVDDQGQGAPSDPSLVSFQPHRNLTP